MLAQLVITVILHFISHFFWFSAKVLQPSLVHYIGWQQVYFLSSLLIPLVAHLSGAHPLV